MPTTSGTPEADDSPPLTSHSQPMQKQSPPSPTVLPLPIIVSEAFSNAATAAVSSMKEAQHFSLHTLPSALDGEGHTEVFRGERII